MAEGERHAPESTESSNKGCFFWGCITSLAILVLGVITVGGIAWYAKSKFDEMVKTYTGDSPKEIQVYEATQEQKEKVRRKVEKLEEATEKGKTGTFTFTEDEINTLIASNSKLKNTAYVDLEANKIHADVSIPLDKEHFGELVNFIGEGRYLNSQITFRVENKRDRAQLYAQEINVSGEPIPEKFMKELRKQDFFEQIYSDPEFKDIRRKLENVEIKDEKLTIKTIAAKANNEQATNATENTTPQKDKPAEQPEAAPAQ